MTDVAPAPAPPAPPAPVDEAEENDSYLEMRPSGGLHVVIDGQKHRLRHPRMREYRHLTDLWRDTAEDLERKSEELQGFLERIFALGDEREARGEPRVTDEERAEDRKMGRDVRIMTETAATEWWVECIKTLGVTANDRNVDADDLPVFCSTVESVNEALQHWRTVPSRSGAR